MIHKFRAWDKETKTMNGMAEIYRNRNQEIELHPRDENIILMQSTGLKDKNGKEIFEGDVAYNGFRKTIVNYGKQAIEEEFGAIREYVGFNLTLACGYPEAVPMNYEIIGNIYENPELLE